jgi:hypothetical protein
VKINVDKIVGFKLDRNSGWIEREILLVALDSIEMDSHLAANVQRYGVIDQLLCSNLCAFAIETDWNIRA